MELSAKAEYACLAMAELAKRHDHAVPTSLKAIAQQFDISHPFLMQIFVLLKGAQLVKSLRGPTGGFKLSRSPTDLSLLEIVEAIDGPRAGTAALEALPEAPLIRALQEVEAKSRQAARQVLKAVTLADLVRQAQATWPLEYQI